MGWATLWAIFSQIHLVTLLEMIIPTLKIFFNQCLYFSFSKQTKHI
jgi:hypothetical protein